MFIKAKHEIFSYETSFENRSIKLTLVLPNPFHFPHKNGLQPTRKDCKIIFHYLLGYICNNVNVDMCWKGHFRLDLDSLE